MSQTNPFEGLSVLYLEDEPLIAFDTSEHLRDLGFGEVKTTYRLAAAQAAASTGKFDLAIFDINVDGSQTSIALGRELAERGTVVIFASGSSSEADHLRDSGHRFVGKPFSLNGLTEEIEAALGLAPASSR